MSNNISDEKPSYERLFAENQALRRELENQRDSQQYIWKLFVETIRRMQVSSASIKAAVSSLLSYDIFWDPGNQHEFLKTINTSTDKVSKLIMLMSLALRAEVGSLTLTSDAQVLQEILAIVQRKASKRFPNLRVNLEMPENGKPVQVDYEYLIMALGFLLELIDIDPEVSEIKIVALETDDGWNLDILGLTDTTLELIETMHSCKTDRGTSEAAHFSPEDILGLHIACEVLHLQGIDIDITMIDQQDSHLLRLTIPSSRSI